MFPKIEAFLIRCSTGCSCCRNENELRGPWRTQQSAQTQAVAYERWPLLSSQYAPRGRYQIKRIEAEQLPDGRLILDNKLIAAGFVDSEDLYVDETLLRGEQIDWLDGTPIATLGASV